MVKFHALRVQVLKLAYYNFDSSFTLLNTDQVLKRNFFAFWFMSQCGDANVSTLNQAHDIWIQ